MIHILNWSFRHIIRFTIGIILFGCLILLALIFWKSRFFNIMAQVDNLILGEEE